MLAADAPSPAGDWHGKLSTGPVELRLILHVQQAAPGKINATLDSIDQGANGIAGANAAFEGNRLKIEFPAVQGLYDAQISADGKTLTGTWTQNGNPRPLNLSRGIPPPLAADPAAATVAPLIGTWEGALEAGTTKLRVRLNVRKDDKGDIRATLDSIDQNAIGMLVSGLSLKGSVFHFAVKGVGATYDGTVDEKQSAIRGTFRQGAGELALDLKKAEK